MFAVIKTGGKQYKVKAKDSLRVEKIEGKVGDSIKFSEVLMVAGDKEMKIGTPWVKGAEVTAKIMAFGKEKKIDVMKFRSKVRYRRKNGHRQPFAELLIESIKA